MDTDSVNSLKTGVVAFIFSLISSGMYCQGFLTINQSDYSELKIKDATPLVLSKLEMSRVTGIRKLKFEKGRYDFYPEKAYEKYCFISNHDNGLRRTPFPLLNVDSLEIDGGGSLFVFHGMILPFVIEGSSSISLKNFTIDWERTFHSETTVIDVIKEENTITLSIDKDYPYEIRNSTLFFTKGGFEHNLERAIFWDPIRKSVVYNARKYRLNIERGQSVLGNAFDQPYPYEIDSVMPQYAYYGRQDDIKAYEIEPGKVKLVNAVENLPEKGWVLVAKGRNGFNRLAPAIRVLKTTELLIENVEVNHAGGMGVIVERSENVTLRNFKVKPSTDGGRILSTTADASHFVGCKGTVILDSCQFENMLDDALNVHGIFMIVEEIIDSHTIGARIGHYQQAGFEFADQEDQIGFAKPKISHHPYSRKTIKKVEKINDRYYKLLFSDPLDGSVIEGDILENLSWYPELIVRNSRFVNNRARGLLISTPRKVIIENNIFSNMMSAILMPTELSFWYESGQTKDVTITRNKFLDCAYGGTRWPVIAALANLSDSTYTHSGLNISDNVFKSFDIAVLLIENLKGLEFVNNTIIPSGNYPPLLTNKSLISAYNSIDLKIMDNKYKGEAEVFVTIDKSGEGSTIFSSNKRISKTK